MFTNLTNSTKAFVFYVLAFGLTVTVSLLQPLLGDATMFLHMYTPMLATLLMLLVVTRDGYSKTSWQSLGLDRLGLRSWWLALVGPLMLMSAVYAIVWISGVGSFVTPAGFTLAGLPLDFVVELVITSIFVLGEEIGFRGYLLPHLLQLGTIRALLLSGFLHGLWHFPLMLLTPVLHITGSWLIVGPIFLVTLTAAGVFYGYLRLTSGSVWSPTLAHGAVNRLLDLFKTFTVATSPITLHYLAGETGVIMMVGTALLAGVILYRLRQRRSSLTVQLPSGV